MKTSKKSTFIKLDRSILGWRWYQDANTFRLFLHLLLTANIKPSGIGEITIGRGEVAVSYMSVANTLKLSIQEVRTAFRHLKVTGEITITRYSKFSVISIVNYESYQARQHTLQQSDQQTPNSQPTSEQHHLKNIRNKEYKEINDDGVPLEELIDDSSDVFVYEQAFTTLPKIVQSQFTELVEQLSQRYWSREITDSEFFAVFQMLHGFCLSKSLPFVVDSDFVGLLTKAFEISSSKNACNVKYLSGIYQKFIERNITTVSLYEDAEYKRWKEKNGI